MDFANPPHPARQASEAADQGSLFSGYHPLVTFGLPVGLVVSSLILFLANSDWLKTQFSVVSPLADNQSNTINSPNVAATRLVKTPSGFYSPSQFISTSQELLADATALAQKLDQTEEDKQAIIANLQRALDTISEGIAIYPKAPQLWYQRGRIYLALEKISSSAFSRAIEDTKRAYRLAPNNPEYAKTLAYLYLRQSTLSPPSLTEALHFLELSHELAPEDNQVLTTLTNVQIKAGLLSQAYENLEQLLTKITDPTVRSQLVSERAALAQLLDQIPAQKSKPFLPQPTATDIALDSNTLFDNDSAAIVAAPQLEPDKLDPQTNVVVAAADAALSPYQDTVAGSAYSDSATLPAGATKIIISNTAVTDANPIYVAPLQTTNATLYVASKRAGTSFTISTDTPLSADLRFQYWITR